MDSSVVYVIGSAQMVPVKIGVTINVERRLKQLQPGAPGRLEALWTTPGDTVLEQQLHARFSEYRVYREWFDLSPLGDAVEAVKEGVRHAYLPAHQMREPPEECLNPELCWGRPCHHVRTVTLHPRI